MVDLIWIVYYLLLGRRSEISSAIAGKTAEVSTVGGLAGSGEVSYCPGKSPGLSDSTKLGGNEENWSDLSCE